MSHLLEGGIANINYLEFFCLFYSIYSINDSYQYGLMDIYFILQVIIQYYAIDYCCLNCSIGNSFIGSCVPLTYHLVLSFEHFLTSRHSKMLQVHFICSMLPS